MFFPLPSFSIIPFSVRLFKSLDTLDELISNFRSISVRDTFFFFFINSIIFISVSFSLSLFCGRYFVLILGNTILVFWRYQTADGGLAVLPAFVLALAAAALLTWWILNRTLLGRAMFAIGGSLPVASCPGSGAAWTMAAAPRSFRPGRPPRRAAGYIRAQGLRKSGPPHSAPPPGPAA